MPMIHATIENRCDEFRFFQGEEEQKASWVNYKWRRGPKVQLNYGDSTTFLADSLTWDRDCQFGLQYCAYTIDGGIGMFLLTFYGDLQAGLGGVVHPGYGYYKFKSIRPGATLENCIRIEERDKGIRGSGDLHINWVIYGFLD
jgi:hypothetical protein